MPAILPTPQAPSEAGAFDVVLSSGFLAMPRHCGFLMAVEEAELRVDGVCGTSSGALVGAFWAAGFPAREIGRRLERVPPWRILVPSLRPWRGLFSLRALRRILAEDLPVSFADLERPFAVGVADRERRPRILHSGPFAPAVAASCAIPGLFEPQRLDGQLWADGGVADRTMLAPFRAWRGQRPTIVHKVERSAGQDRPLPDDALVIETPRSRARFTGWRDFGAQVEEARALAEHSLAMSLDTSTD